MFVPFLLHCVFKLIALLYAIISLYLRKQKPSIDRQKFIEVAKSKPQNIFVRRVKKMTLGKTFGYTKGYSDVGEVREKNYIR